LKVSKNRSRGKAKLRCGKLAKLKQLKNQKSRPKAFTTCAYFLTCFKIKLHPSCHGGGGEVEEKSKRSMGVEGPWSKDKIVVSVYA